MVSYAGYTKRDCSARRRQENTEHPDLFDEGDLGDILLRNTLKSAVQTVQKKSVHQYYHAVVELKSSSLRSTEQKNKFHEEGHECYNQLDDNYDISFEEWKRSAHLYQGTANLNV